MTDRNGGRSRLGKGRRRRAGGNARGDGGQAFRRLAGRGRREIDAADVIRAFR